MSDAQSQEGEHLMVDATTSRPEHLPQMLAGVHL